MIDDDAKFVKDVGTKTDFVSTAWNRDVTNELRNDLLFQLLYLMLPSNQEFGT